ncbi:hypothetical protein D3C81_840570 [compost metagenome]
MRSANGGVSTETMLIIPKKKISKAGPTRAKSCLPRQAKAINPNNSGSQNSNTRYRMVMPKPSA